LKSIDRPWRLMVARGDSRLGLVIQ